QGWVIFWSMFALLSFGLITSLASETLFHPFNITGPAMEGKETRFGVTGSILWSTFTSAASNGSVNAMLSSLSPLAGGVAMFNLMLGEVIFGGAGAGLYGMLLFVILTVFIAGLMVGRTPEYLGKKIEASEIRLTMVGVLLPSAAILIGSAVALGSPSGLSSLAHAGPHGLSEVLYAFSSAAGNNGSAFAGLNANTPFYNVLLGFAMLLGRFGVILPVIAIAGRLASKKVTPLGVGTFVTDQPLFAGLLIAILLIVGGLTFFPAIALGPVLEHFLMLGHKTF
ncbi:MAG: potassium-transporting ATPase subunit KdpA, partial [Proteobacteria bacterium]